MRLFVNKLNGEIIGTVDGFAPSGGIVIVPQGLTSEDVAVIDIPLGHELEQFARQLEDPSNRDVQIRHYKMDTTNENMCFVPKKEGAPHFKSCHSNPCKGNHPKSDKLNQSNHLNRKPGV